MASTVDKDNYRLNEQERFSASFQAIQLMASYVQSYYTHTPTHPHTSTLVDVIKQYPCLQFQESGIVKYTEPQHH